MNKLLLLALVSFSTVAGTGGTGQKSPLDKVKWHEAIGQSLYYSAMTGKKAGIVLIVNPRTKERYLK